MRTILGVRAMLAFGLVAFVSVVAAWADDPSTEEKEKERLKRQHQQYEESLGWYRLSVGPDLGKTMKPRSVLHWTNDVRSQKGETNLLIWTDAGRPEALASVYPWYGNLQYEFVSLARDKGLTAREGDRKVWTPDAAGVAFRDLPDARAPGETPAARLKQAKSSAERFKASIINVRDGREVPEELRLLPTPIYRYALAESKDAHPDLIDGVMFAFVQGTDPEAVLMLEAVRRGDKTAWQYAFGRATGWGVEAKLGISVIWTASGSAQWNNARETTIVFARPLVE